MMRCAMCGWPVAGERCPCDAAAKRKPPALLPVGSKVLARQGRGVSMRRWDCGEVQGHVGAIHRVETCFGAVLVIPRDVPQVSLLAPRKRAEEAVGFLCRSTRSASA